MERRSSTEVCSSSGIPENLRLSWDREGYYLLCLWFRASLIYINNCPTRCSTKQSFYYSASSLYMFRTSTTPIIRSTQNCNTSLRYWSYFFCSATSLQRGQASLVDTRNM